MTEKNEMKWGIKGVEKCDHVAQSGEQKICVYEEVNFFEKNFVCWHLIFLTVPEK